MISKLNTSSAFSSNPLIDSAKTEPVENSQTKPENPGSNTNLLSQINRPHEGMYNLSPMDRYRFVLNQGFEPNSANLNSPDPETSLKEANKILNQAILLPQDDNPSNQQLTMAMIMKRMAQSKLDIAA